MSELTSYKCRAKLKGTNDWVYGSYFEAFKDEVKTKEEYDELKWSDVQSLIIAPGGVKNGRFEPVQIHKVKKGTAGRFTGFYDKNGRELYEGDIITNQWCFAQFFSVIRYGQHKKFGKPENPNDGNYGFYVEHLTYRNDMYRSDLCFYINRCEVYGNIIDNPNILEKKGK